MTLVLSAYNSSSIVVGADSLRGTGCKKDGSKILLTDAKKLFQGGPSWAVMAAGNLINSEKVYEFLDEFIADMQSRGIGDVDTIISELARKCARVIIPELGSPPADIQFLVAGFSAGGPKLFLLQSHDGFRIQQSKKSYLAAGKTPYAYPKLAEMKINERMATKEIRLAIRETLEGAKRTMPEDVGGALHVRTLKP